MGTVHAQVPTRRVRERMFRNPPGNLTLRSLYAFITLATTWFSSCEVRPTFIWKLAPLLVTDIVVKDRTFSISCDKFSTPSTSTDSGILERFVVLALWSVMTCSSWSVPCWVVERFSQVSWHKLDYPPVSEQHIKPPGEFWFRLKGFVLDAQLPQRYDLVMKEVGRIIPVFLESQYDILPHW